MSVLSPSILSVWGLSPNDFVNGHSAVYLKRRNPAVTAS
jgi:hypothetical protein